MVGSSAGAEGATLRVDTAQGSHRPARMGTQARGSTGKLESFDPREGVSLLQ